MINSVQSTKVPNHLIYRRKFNYSVEKLSVYMITGSQ